MNEKPQLTLAGARARSFSGLTGKDGSGAIETRAARLRLSSVVAWGFVCAAAIIPLTSLALDPTKSIFQYNLQNWTRQEGLPSDKVTAITQTTDGYLWLGTQNGLVRFNGLDFKRVPLSLPQTGGQEIASMKASGKGGLWLAIDSGQFCYFDGHEFSVVSASAVPPRPKEVMEARDGTTWLAAENLLARRTAAGTVETFDVKAKVEGLAQDTTGRIWIGTDEHGLFIWENGQIQPVVTDIDLSKEIVFSLAADKDGKVWVGTQHYLVLLDARGNVLERHEHTVTDLLVDRHGTLWVGTAQGLVRYRNGTGALLTKQDGLANDFVRSLIEDREGSVWVGTQGGLTQISDVKFPIFSDKEGLTVPPSLSVAASRKGGIWATLHRGLAYFDGDSFTSIYSADLFPNPYIKMGFEARNGDFYYVDGSKNINVLSNGKLVARYVNQGWTEALGEDDESVLAGIGTSLMRLKGGTAVPYAFKPGQEPDFQSFDNFWVARDGAIWVASYNGIYRVRNGESQRWSTANGLTGNRVHFVFEDVDGAIWAGLPTGMARIKKGVLRNITSASGLYDDRVFAIVPDDYGNFWIDSGRGIFRIARHDLNAFADGEIDQVSCDPFDTRDAVKFNDRADQEYSGCKSADGRIWFPSPWGVIMIDPANFVRNSVPPPVYIEDIQIEGKSVTDRSNARLKVGQERVEFTFTALSYIAPKNLKVRYQLEGFDSTWTDAGVRRSALYRLKPGRYAFHVQAANADGVWNSTGDTYEFELPPPFHQTIWFYVLCSMGGVLGLFGAYGWKVRSFKVRQRKLQAANELLEAKVHERTAEVAYERDLLRTMLENSPDPIFFKDAESRFVKAAQVFAERLGVSSPKDIVGKNDFDFFNPEHAQASLEDEREIIRTGQPLVGKVEKEMWADGRITWVITTKVPWRDKHGKIIGTFGLSKEITKIKESEAKLIELHKQLVETSRQAGMAEVATGVLHNVGNVLNSVNVSATLVIDKVRTSKVSFVPKVSGLLEEHTADLAAFLTSDPKGQKIPSYLATLGKQLLSERDLMIEELGHLRKNIEHIKEIVTLQQSFAKVSGVSETVSLAELIDDAIRMNGASLERHQVQLVRDYNLPIAVTIERHKVIQILINLIRNAKNACDDSGGEKGKKIILRTAKTETTVQIAVIDNGIGIAAENLTRIFAHGFTTRKGGHGFGLHSGALAAKELGGRLTVESAGIGKGATFTLELPITSPFDSTGK
jgi:PAS domain S-box-containing protein